MSSASNSEAHVPAPIKLRQVDGGDPMPKYLQTQRIIIDAIRDGGLPAGCKLPSTKDIGELVNVSLITAHKALESMVQAGLLRREVGRGTFVRDDVHEAMSSGQQVSIGLVLDPQINLNDFYHSSILDALRRAAQASKIDVQFYIQNDFRVPPRRPAAKGGVICIHPPLGAREHVEKLADRVPTVVLGGSFPGTKVACVDCNNHSGAEATIRHLHELGHRRYLLICGPSNLSNSRDRAAGARRALANAGVELTDDDVVISGDSVSMPDAAIAAVRRRLDAPDRPTALVTGGYYLALSAIHITRQAGLTIPRDVSVVGFDDPQAATLLDPPLTTVRQPLTEMADRAFGILRDWIIDGVAPDKGLLLPTELVIRGTTGPAFDRR
jgi:DNA-binding LacI/PurR family transcriptional regulator